MLFDLDEESNRKPWVETTPDPWANDDRPDEMMAWLIPAAVAVLAFGILWLCKHYGWLQ